MIEKWANSADDPADFPVVLIIAVLVQVLCQAYKVVFYSCKKKQLDLSYFTSSGGMPSAHTAFVTSLSVAVGLRDGFTSPIFAACVVFATIIIHDAYRLRGTVEKHNAILKEIATHHRVTRTLPRTIGHSKAEIIVGLIVGGVLGALLTILIF